MSVAPTAVELRMMPDPMLPHPAVIDAIKPEAYGISTFSLVFTDPAEASTYRFQPGQFNMIYLPGFGEVAISLSSDPGAPRCWDTLFVMRAVSRARSAASRWAT